MQPGRACSKCRQGDTHQTCQASADDNRSSPSESQAVPSAVPLALSCHLSCWGKIGCWQQKPTHDHPCNQRRTKQACLSCPTTEMNLALRCTASSRQLAPPTDLFFRYLSDVKPDCYRASLLTSPVLIGAQATPLLAGLFSRKILCCPPERSISDTHSAAKRSGLLHDADDQHRQAQTNSVGRC